MSDKDFTERYPSFPKSEQGRVILELIEAQRNKWLRSLIMSENAEDRGKVQILQKLAKDLFGVDLLK